MTDIREYLAHKPLLFDGGMGTYYAQKFGFDPECCERANLLYPARVAVAFFATRFCPV